MSIARKIAVPTMALAALIGLSGCGLGGDHKVGETATVGLTDDSAWEVTVTSVEPAPAEVTEQFDTEDAIYFVHFTTKMVKQGSTGVSGVDEHVLSKVEGNTYVTTSFSSIEQCQKPAVSERKAAFAKGETITSCVPIAGDDGKKVVGVYIGSSDLKAPGSQTWTID